MTVNDEELARRALGVPEPDPRAEERAKALLRQRFVAPARRSGRRRAGLVGVSTVAVVVALILVANTLSGSNAAARELHRLRFVASRQPTPQLAQGEAFHLSETVFGPQGGTILGSNESYMRLVRYRYDIWEERDGSGNGTKTYLETEFASPADKATWERLGSPPLPQAGDVVTDQFKPGEAPFFDLSVLSTDPSTLLSQLRSGVPEPRSRGDDHTFGLIGDVLGFGHATSQQRAALFEVAAHLDGVQLVGNVVDPLGRAGVGLAVSGSSTTTMLVFDPDSAELLANETFPSNADLASAAPTEWTAFQPVEVVKSSEAPSKSG